MPECDSCIEHSGHKARIVTLERESAEQWAEITQMKKDIRTETSEIDNKVNGLDRAVSRRMNQILGGLVVGLILLAGNLIVSLIKIS